MCCRNIRNSSLRLMLKALSNEAFLSTKKSVSDFSFLSCYLLNLEIASRKELIKNALQCHTSLKPISFLIYGTKRSYEICAVHRNLVSVWRSLTKCQLYNNNNNNTIINKTFTIVLDKVLHVTFAWNVMSISVRSFRKNKRTERGQ